MKIRKIRIEREFENFDELYDALKLNKDVFYTANYHPVFIDKNNNIYCIDNSVYRENENNGKLFLGNIYDRDIQLSDFILVDEDK